MSVSIWFKAESQIYSYIAASGSQLQQGFSFTSHPASSSFRVVLPSGKGAAVIETVLTVDSWFYLVGTFHENEGLHLYINGLLEAMNDLPSS